MPDTLEIFGTARYRAHLLYPYFSTALFALQPRLVPDLAHIAMGPIAVDRYWRVYYDPVALAAEGVEHAAGMILHELHHVLEAHFTRAERINAEPVAANLSQDISINGPLSDMGVALPTWGVYPETFGFPPGKLWEDYYLLIQQKFPHPKSGRKKGKPEIRLPNCGSGAHGQPQPWEEGAPSDASPGITEHEGHLLQRLTAEAIKEHIQQHGRGTIPAGLERWADAQLQPAKVPWQRELASVVRAGVATVAGTVDYTYSRISRRASAVRGVVLPALRAPVPEIAIVADASGSMGNAECSTELAEIGGILRTIGYVTTVRVLSVDTCVQSCQRVFDAQQVTLIGGGGTDMRVGVDAAVALKPRPNIVIVLTDGLTPWGETPIRGVQVIACLIGDGPDAPAWMKSIRVKNV